MHRDLDTDYRFELVYVKNDRKKIACEKIPSNLTRIPSARLFSIRDQHRTTKNHACLYPSHLNVHALRSASLPHRENCSASNSVANALLGR